MNHETPATRTVAQDAHTAPPSRGPITETTTTQRPEEALRREHDRAQGYLDTVQTMIVALDEQGRITTINRKGCQLLGWTEEELIGQSWFACCLPQPDGALKVFPSFQALMAGGIGTMEYFENPVLTRNGEVREIAWHNALLRDQDGRVVGTLSSGDDITDRKQTEAALRASEMRYRRLFESAKDGVLILDAETGAVVDVNPFLVELLGFSRETFLGMKLWDLGFFRDIVASKDSFEQLQVEEYVRYEDKPLETKDGRRIDVEFVSNVYLVDGHKVIQCNVRDITERKQGKAKQAKLEAQLQHAQKMESVGRLAGGVAHDFNNMLGVILGHTELALEQVTVGQPLHADLTEIRGAAIRSANLTRQLLAFARKQTVAPRVLDLNDTVASMLSMLRRLIGENIDLQWRPGSELWPVKMDPSQVDQILANLCVNARDAISGVGKLTIETCNRTLDDHYCAAHAGCEPGQYVRLAVSDDGCGMDKDTQSHLFEPFFTTKPMGEGTGLGLATVYGAVKQNRGLIDVYSEPGHGTTFLIHLPRHAAVAVQDQAESAAGPKLNGHETILVVEDEPSILTLTKTMLEHQGYTVLAAGTPGEAVRLAEGHPLQIHLLMTDVVMPEMSGRTLAKNLLAVHPRLACLFMSGYTADVITHHGVLDEGVQFIQKPFSMNQLSAKVREALDARR